MELVEKRELDRERLSEWVRAQVRKYGTYMKVRAAIAAANPGEKIVSDETIRLWKGKMSATLTEDSVRQLARFRGEPIEETNLWLYGSVDGPLASAPFGRSGKPAASQNGLMGALGAAATVEEVTKILDAEIIPALQFAARRITQLSAKAKQLPSPKVEVSDCIKAAIVKKGLPPSYGLRDFLSHLSRDCEMSLSRAEEIIMKGKKPSPDEEAELIYALGEYLGQPLSIKDFADGSRAILVDEP